jgi:hypothetical protein
MHHTVLSRFSSPSDVDELKLSGKSENYPLNLAGLYEIKIDNFGIIGLMKMTMLKNYGVALCLLVNLSLSAATFTANFDDGLFPAGTTKDGVGYVSTTGGVNNSGDYHLTDAVNGEQGEWVIFDFAGGVPVHVLNVSFQVELGGSTSGTPADGFSFNWDTNLPTTLGETGGGNGLTVIFDTYNGGSPYAAVKWHGGIVASNATFNFSAADNGFVPVEIIMANGAVTVIFNGTPLFNNVGLPGFAPIAGGQIAFAARTGAFNERHYLDNVSIDTGTPIFQPILSYARSATLGVGGRPRGVVAADVNGDSKMDLISADETSSLLTVLTNNGQGGFVTASQPPVGGLPESVVAADVNGDNKPDLIDANSAYGTLDVWTNDGHGGFVAASVLSVGSAPNFVTAADINGDGKVDLIAANTGGASITVLTNNGVGGFVTSTTYPVGTEPISVAVGDFNGDGKPDLACGYILGNSITILTNSGAGIFGLNATCAVGKRPEFVAAADLNKDGKLDLISANSLDNTITVLLNNGSGIFSSNVTYAVGSFPAYIVATDLNQDGNVDLAVANENDSTVTVLLNNGNGQFLRTLNLPVGNSPSGVAIADINGDGKPDLISSDYGGTVTVLSSSLTFSTGNPLNIGMVAEGSPLPALSVSGALPSGVTFTDHGDGSGALSGTPTVPGIYSVTLSAANSEGTFTQNVTFTVEELPTFPALTYSYVPITSPGVGSAGVIYLAATNLTPNGPVSLITDNGEIPGAIQVLHNNGTGGFSTGPAYVTGAQLFPAVTADFNGDSRPDFAGVDSEQSRVIIFTNGTGGILVSNTAYAVGAGPDAITTADLNGHGKPDIITANSSGNSLTVLTNTGNGTFKLDGTFPVGPFPESVIATDINGDGRPDLISANTDGTLTVLTNGGGGIFGSNLTCQAGSSPLALAAADFDGNGQMDLVCANFNAGTLSVLRNAGGSFPVVETYSVGSITTSALITDANGDGKPDLVGLNFNNDAITILTNNGFGEFKLYATYPTGYRPEAIVTADVNGDGLPDLICGNSDGTLSILLLTNSYQMNFTEGTTRQATIAVPGFPTPAFTLSGTLPPGVTFFDNHDGTVTFSGMPTTNGIYPITLTASNAAGSVSLNYTIATLPLPTPPPLIFGANPLGTIVSWPLDYSSYTLQTSTNLINWQDYTDEIASYGSNYVYTGSVFAGPSFPLPSFFYRLKN